MSFVPRTPGASALTALFLSSGLWLSACTSAPETRPTQDASAPIAQDTVAKAPPVVEPPRRSAAEDFDQAVAIARTGELTAAETALRALVTQEPKLDYAWTNLGIVQERLGKHDDAERSYRQALALAPEQQSAWDCLTRLYGRTGRSAALETELRGLLETKQDSVTLRTALAVTLLQQKKLEPAATEAKRALKGDERHTHAMQVLAQVYYREGKHELARMVLENARDIAPADAATRNALGLVYLALNVRPQALEEFKESARLRPDFAEARNNFGAMLNEAQDYAAAVTELEAAVRSAPDFAAARLNLGNAYRGTGDFERAKAAYEHVLELRPQQPDPLFNLAILYLDVEPPGGDPVGRYKTALTYFERYEAQGGKDDRIPQYTKDARKSIEREERRLERERKDQLRKAAELEKAQKEAAKQAPDATVTAPAANASTTSPASPTPPPAQSDTHAPTDSARSPMTPGTTAPSAVSQPGTQATPPPAESPPAPTPAKAGSGKLADDRN
ncbi:tetratricopeptide repeat protein [Myxococcus sp. K38C18041901]|uniref:tetratricopeptide repeat protein n=1 Tax=Myxococcus guangdongensis TaxID=2906760 RepID=UPI0020A7A38F|nr:tetratricopeptide repeat protein [Myxococcus guangdongensis]MCP3065395.1 tetratricopeptide repeat protein [Myxococcus guangdongensis]